MVYVAGSLFTVGRKDGFFYVYEDGQAIYETSTEQDAAKYADSLNNALWYRNKHSAKNSPVPADTGPEATNLGG